MKALVLSGGSIKGSWQAGAVAEALERGFTPDIVTGISVGSINAAALAAWQSDDWAAVGTKLADFWTTNITSADKVAKKRGWIDLLIRVVFKNWRGLIDTDAVNALVRKTLGTPPAGPLITRVGTVGLKSGAIEYIGPESPDFMDAVMASAMEPVVMESRPVRGQPYVDGGIRDIAPLREAITLGANEIIAVVCSPAAMVGWNGNHKDVMALVGRCLGIVTNEIVTNDVKRCESINRLLLTLPPEIVASNPDLKGKRVIKVTLIRPTGPLALDLTSFNGDDIKRAVQQGREDARRVLA